MVRRSTQTIAAVLLVLIGSASAYAIGFVDSPSASCRKIKGNQCAITWYYLAVDAAPNYALPAQMRTRVRCWDRSAAAAALVVLASAPAFADLVPCVGRCEDGMGNAMTVENRCDEVAERCVAGCDTSGARPEPYAECEGTGRGTVPPPSADPGGVRERDGD